MEARSQLIPYLLREGLSLNRELATSARPAGEQGPSTGVTGVCHYALLKEKQRNKGFESILKILTVQCVGMTPQS